MNKYIRLFCFQLFVTLVLTGCTSHIPYIEKKRDIDIIADKKLTVKTDKEICVFYDKKAYIHLDCRHRLTYSYLAFDYGEAIKKIGEKFFLQYKNVMFIDTADSLTKDVRCNFVIFPKVEEAIYTSNNNKPYNTELETSINFQVEDKTRNLTYQKSYKSEPLVIPWTMTSEYILIGNTFTFWIYEQIVNMINELDKNEKR